MSTEGIGGRGDDAQVAGHVSQRLERLEGRDPLGGKGDTLQPAHRLRRDVHAAGQHTTRRVGLHQPGTRFVGDREARAGEQCGGRGSGAAP